MNDTSLAMSTPTFASLSPLEFERDINSPFSDGYSIEKEKIVLKDLLEAEEPNIFDPRYPRFEMLETRERELKQMRTEWTSRTGADKTVPDYEATRMRELGSLVDEGEDSMQLHTKEAFRLFMGRARDVEGKYSPIPGGKRAASSLKSLWYLSGQNNPYADWGLLRHSHHIEQMQQSIVQQTNEYLRQLQTLSDRGLKISILRSAEPKEVTIGFKSPYGYAIADFIVQYDYFVRMVKTLVRKARFTDSEGYEVIRQFTRKVRAAFEDVNRFERFLMRPELRPLSRADFLPGANGEATKRTQAVRSIFGLIPTDIFSAKTLPRHSRRRVELSKEEINMLERLAVSDDFIGDKDIDEKGLV